MFQPLPKLGPRHGPSLAPTIEPFYNQSDQASIRDSFFEHSHQPIVIHVIKETSNIGFHDPAIVPNVQGFAQIQAGLTRSLPRSVANAFIIEVRFPDTF
jgi:hypothetical protein